MFKFNMRIDINTKILKIENRKEFVETTCNYWKNVLKYYLNKKIILKIVIALSELLENSLKYSLEDSIYFEILVYKETCVIITNNTVSDLKFKYISSYIKEIKDNKYSFKFYYTNKKLGLYTLVKIIDCDLNCYKVKDKLYMEAVII